MGKAKIDSYRHAIREDIGFKLDAVCFIGEGTHHPKVGGNFLGGVCSIFSFSHLFLGTTPRPNGLVDFHDQYVKCRVTQTACTFWGSR
jgi:hypothetical protein